MKKVEDKNKKATTKVVDKLKRKSTSRKPREEHYSGSRYASIVLLAITLLISAYFYFAN